MQGKLPAPCRKTIVVPIGTQLHHKVIVLISAVQLYDKMQFWLLQSTRLMNVIFGGSCGKSFNLTQ